jgi:signal transduction histidine kinase
MIVRWIAALSLLLAIFGSGPALAQQQDFLDQMTLTLATDPARAGQIADQQIVMLNRSDAAPSLPLAEAYWVRAQADFRLGDEVGARAAIARARASLPNERSSQRVLGYIDLLAGLLARSDGEIGRALQMFRTAQRAFITAGDRRGHALALQSVGVLYNDVGDGQNALQLFRLAEETYPSGDDVFSLSLNNNLGIAHQAVGDYASAKASLERAYVIATRLQMRMVADEIRISIARCELIAGNLSAANRWMVQIGDINRLATMDQRRDADAILAELSLRGGRLAAARSYIDRALESLDPATSVGATARKVHYTAYEVLRAQGRSAAALVQLEAVRRIDAYDRELIASNRAALLSAQFQLAAQNTRIAELKARELQREVGFQRTITVIVIVAGLVSLGLLVGLLVIAIRSRDRARRGREELAVSHGRLERALAAKTEFLASTSHELRTPLNGILGMTQIMLVDSQLPPATRSQIELVHDAGSTMRALVDDILDVAKIEHGGFTINPKASDVQAIVERVTRLFADQARANGVSLTARFALPEERMLIDPDRLTQILFNLIGNALKFTHEGAIDIVAEVVDAAGDAPRLRIAVRDTGIGIDPASHDAVFEMFHQIDATRTRAYGGTGLGLAICRQLARAMGGDIRLASRLGEGACFTLDLPWVARPAADHVAPDDVPAVAVAQVAVIATDPMRAAMLSAIVRRAGMTLLAVDTQDAMAAVPMDERLTLLVDVAAAEAAMRHIAVVPGAAARTIIVGDMAAGAGDGWPANVRRVPFARGPIEQILRACDETSGANRADSGLCFAPAAPMCSGNMDFVKQGLNPSVAQK